MTNQVKVNFNSEAIQQALAQVVTNAATYLLDEQEEAKDHDQNFTFEEVKKDAIEWLESNHVSDCISEPGNMVDVHDLFVAVIKSCEESDQLDPVDDFIESRIVGRIEASEGEILREEAKAQVLNVFTDGFGDKDSPYFDSNDDMYLLASLGLELVRQRLGVK